MKLFFDNQLATKYKSASQKARILTEYWVQESAFCPNCGHTKIDKYPNNKPVADFFCENCKEDYELKSKSNNIGTKILDGAYDKKIKRLESNNNPNLFILNYKLENLSVINFFVIPKYFFVPEIIEKRKPLTINARRAGWIGSNIILDKIPNTGKIFIVKERNIISKEKVLAEWKRTLFLKEEKEISARGWLLDIMRCIEKLGKQQFSLEDMYKFEKELSLIHPHNKHIKEKIRQQLQILRDKGYLIFSNRGVYKLI